MVYSDSYTLSSVAPGEHTIYVGLVDASHALLGNAFSRVFNMANVSSQLAVTYGSTFEGADGSVFSNSAGTKFDVSNKGLLSLGFFNSGFDVEAESQAGNLNNVLANYNILHSDSFSAAPAPGFLTTGGSVSENGSGKTPYLFVFAGVDDVADIATATEHGLFTSSSFAVIPDGASPVPVDYTLSSITFDTILMGEEVAGGGFGGANAYATTVVGQAIKDQTPALTVLGDTEMTIQWEQEFIDPGAVAHDFEDGDLTDEILVEGDQVDVFVAGTYVIRYSVMDSAGNLVTDSRTVSVNRSFSPQVASAGSGKVSVAYGSAFEGSDGNIFGSSDGTGFNAGTLAPLLWAISLLGLICPVVLILKIYLALYRISTSYTRTFLKLQLQAFLVLAVLLMLLVWVRLPTYF